MYGRKNENGGFQSADSESELTSINPENYYGANKNIHKPLKELETDATKSPTSPPIAAPQPSKKPSGKFASIFKGKKGKVSPIIVILIALMGGGSAFTALYAPGMTLMHFSEVVMKDTNSLLSAATKTDQQLWRAKLKETTAGSCGKVKIACRFQTVNVEKTTSKFKRAGIALEFDKSAGWGDKRGKINKMTFTDQFGKTIEITKAEQLNDAMKNNIEFRKAMLAAHNPKFATLKDAPAINFLKKMKTSYAKKLTGSTKEELDKNMQNAVDGKVSLDTPRLKPEVDEDGKETGRYVDDKGVFYTAEEAKGLNTSEALIKNAPTSKTLLNGLAKGASITGTLDTACTANNLSNAVETGSKLIRARELIRFAMVLNNTTSAMKAGKATPEQVEYLGKKIVEPDMREMVVDENKWYEPGTNDKPPMVKNPNYKKSGLDAIFYKMSAYQDTPKITANEQRFLAGGGPTGTLAKFNTMVAKVLGGGTKKDLRAKCKVVQNTAVRAGSLVVGIIAGIGSFGWTTALGVAGSMAFSFAVPYLTSMLSDMMAGNVTGPDLAGADMINAAAVGTSATMNGNARSHGLMPLSPEQMVEYQNTNRQVQVAYEQVDRYAAQATPFDITNQYSFLGSLARTTLPAATVASTHSLMAFSSIPQIFSTAFSALAPSASAVTDQKVSIERYQMCNDETYEEMNIAADPTCVLLYGLPPEAMEIDPIENAEWMAAHDEILVDSDEGAPKDNERDWNYKKYLEDCVVQQPGAHENPDENDDHGAGCSNPDNFTANWHYAKFKLSVEVAKGQDGELPGVDGGSQDNFSDGESGAVGANGWAYPTTSDASVTSGFGPRWGSEHRGIDLVPPEPLGKPIFAARDGEVIAAGPADGFGNWIVIKHDDVDGKRYDTVYGHMASDGVLVSVGQKVTAGQEIGKIGNEGQSTGAHLHFEIWENGHTNFAGGQAIDPAPIIRGAHNASPGAEERV